MESRKKTIFFKCQVFVLTFFGYALLHANRKTFSNVKSVISAEWTPSAHNLSSKPTQPYFLWNARCLFENGDQAEYFLGVLDTVFMVAYAVGLYLSGFLGDRLDLRKVLTFGLCGTSICVVLFGCLSEWLHVYSLPYYVILWIINGLLQSTGWPAMVAVMSNWYGRSSRGVVLGLWSACASVGNILGSLMVAAFLPYGYDVAFLVPAGLLCGWGVIIFFGLVPHPSAVGLPSPDDLLLNEDADAATVTETEPLLVNEEEDEGPEAESSRSPEPMVQVVTIPPPPQQTQAIGFLQAVCIPGVLAYSLAYACLKFVNYSFFFWLPYYLTSRFGWTQEDADEVSIWYDIGGIIAGVSAGFISDRMQKRSPVIEVMLLLAAPSLFFYTLSPNNKVINGALMTVMGVFIGGPATLISSAVAADLGSQSNLRGNQKALATVTGIIDGTGSAGGAVGQLLIPVLHLALGWQDVFYVFVAMVLLTWLCILPILVRELRQMGCCQQCQPSRSSATHEGTD